MVLGWLFGRSARTKTVVPTLYPGLDPLRLEQFLAEPEYARIKSFANVYVLPFVSQNSGPSQMCFGLGLSRLMIRNLMLLRGVSIHGPEDTPPVPYEAAPGMAAGRVGSVYVTGIADLGADGYSVQVEVHRAGRPVRAEHVGHADFATFLRECSFALARLLGCEADEDTVRAWGVGQPRSAKSLIWVGKTHLEFERTQTVERGREATALLATDPDFAVAAWDIDEELPNARPAYFQALQRDPFNAQICFQAFCAVWRSQGPQPDALQFCRKAIELSPGHGKAHMCAPHAAQRPVEMLWHSELGYRLLPGNSFAVNNYVLALTRANAPPVRLIELAEEGIVMDPSDPGNYERMIELCVELRDFKAALATAERLQQLYEPEMNERALYCLRQNPHRAQLIDSGAYVPAAANRQRIVELRQKIRSEER
ncbi:transmembrane and tpr repeat-containing protein 3 : Uncharacterized protein OS=Pirellula staleyi (strain ATCC 27377 / DSM 6068 / ICPB 4128) GN=Psta_0850 PE=4 SV=1 [Gemmata massiliana]|uniref:Transmembrane and tpr repeat-containing protein 3: Uncharacterized protein n=1 Tax=Gemmata massiliana TaxID=1210884 RepID=A0A6P2D7X4_9BACT|nr:hypothetical protein [Gemmata massiliana]VTR96234.1 transmembrane and tpr repeat-containing protein 3 : Uncharacterized protein OS=Pirellula staleyi (strain ATCC 27377 / DSM 6068 / ICPB 4128) GN=Psta_0850 PE=4 SV=1 [Gemmata massiliana]